ncbi:MAG: hypothetical protein ABI045_05790 [Flavobacteriales bacterium]
MLYQRFSHLCKGTFIYRVEELSPALERLKQINKINRPSIDPSKIHITLKPERPIGVNIV